MSFQPVVPMSGLAGWRFLQRTNDAQQAAFQNASTIKSDADYFRENIGDVQTAEQLVADRRLLSVALGAFGLGDDINNKFFIRRILEDGIVKSDALANRLADERYKDLSEAFGFGDLPIARTQLTNFAEEIVDRFHQKQFQIAVGNQDNDLRLALNTESAITEIASEEVSNDTKWFRIMGNPPLRQVVETALGLPNSFSQLDLDQQLNVLKDRTASQFGSEDVSQFLESDQVDKLVQRFLLRAQVSSSEINSGSTALTLIQSMPRLTPPLFG